MAVNESAAYGIYPHHIALNDLVQALLLDGFDKESICMMLAPTHPVAATVRMTNGKFDREANTVTAGLIGWLSEFGAVLIPTFGFFIRSRAFFRALISQQDSIAPCGCWGTLMGLGFAAREARQFEKRLRESGVLLYVSCPTSRMTRALDLLRRAGAEEAGIVQSRAAGLPPPRPGASSSQAQLALGNPVLAGKGPAYRKYSRVSLQTPCYLYP